MYNTKFQKQLDDSRRHLFGNTGAPPPEDVCAAYTLPLDVPIYPCKRLPSGEMVPDLSAPPIPRRSRNLPCVRLATGEWVVAPRDSSTDQHGQGGQCSPAEGE